MVVAVKTLPLIEKYKEEIDMKKMKAYLMKHWKKILWCVVLTIVTFGTYGLIKVLSKHGGES